MKIKWERITRGNRSVMWYSPNNIASIHWGIAGGKRLFKIERFQGGGVLLKFAFEENGILTRTISEAKERAQEELDKWIPNENKK